MQKVKLINWDPFGLIQNMFFFYEFFLKTPVTFRLLSPQSFYNTLAGTGAKYCMFLQHPELKYLKQAPIFNFQWKFVKNDESIHFVLVEELQYSV